MRRSFRILLRVLAWLLLAALVALFMAWIAMRASLPELDGDHHVAGLSAPVIVGRDAYGVPDIQAATRLDAARATGFVHAQDRYFQMDLTRRAAAGELAALLGPTLADSDARLRVNRFRERARQVLAGLDDGDRALLEAYTQGVNAGLASLRARPFEYLVLRARPQPWRPEDSLLVVYAMWLDLQGSELHTELQRDRLHAALPASLYQLVARSPSNWDAALDGSELPVPPLPDAAQYDLRHLDRAVFALADGAAAHAARLAESGQADAALVGSNNWALAGSRTASGRALVANDMHLGLRVPNTWYRLRLRARDEDVDITGVTLPGAPVVVAGSNGHVAWGFTNSYGDYLDLVRAEPVPGQPDSYATVDGPRRFERHDEVIAIAGAPARHVVVEDTIWGPVVAKDADGTPLAAAWTAYRPEAINLRLVDMERAVGVEDAVQIAASAGIPAQNAMIGDATGHIAWVIAGRVPLRAGFDPTLPADWTVPGTGWTGWVAPEAQPRIEDPAGGAAWSANARVVGGDMLALIGDGGYAHGARSHQIREDLAKLSQARPADFLQIQLDDRARYLAEWQPLLISVLAEGGPAYTGALKLVKGWTGYAAIGDAGYRVLREFERTVTERSFEMLTVEARARWPGFRWHAPARFTDVAWRLVNLQPANLLDPRYPSWDAWLLAAADEAIAAARQGCDSLAQCTWGRRNTMRIQHPLSRALPFLSPLLDMPADELPGDWSMPRVQSPVFGASERFAVEPGREAEAYFHMPGGESGNPMSPYYRAGHEAWAQGEPLPFLPGPAVHTLTLTP